MMLRHAARWDRRADARETRTRPGKDVTSSFGTTYYWVKGSRKGLRSRLDRIRCLNMHGASSPHLHLAMDPSRSYNFDPPHSQLALYPTHPQRPHHLQSTSSPSAPSQAMRQQPFQDPSAPPSFYTQQQLPPSAQGAPQAGHYMRPYPSYTSSAVPPSHFGHPNQPPSLGTSHAHPTGFRSPPAYTDSFQQYPMTSNQWSMNRDVDHRGFIPTPSDMTSVYPAIRSHSGPEFRNQQSVEPSAEFAQHPPLTHTRSHSNPYPTLGAQNPMTGSPPPQPLAERFPCDKCDKTFSRSHDRKRHYETQHHPVPVLHRCRYCEKEFSRADSLKRHLDNGCDEMP